MGSTMNLFGSSKKKEKKPAGASRPAKSVAVSGFLSESAVRILPAGISKEEALRQLIEAISIPDQAAALQQVLERDASRATPSAPGLAIPHARIVGISKVLAAVGVSAQGVADPSAEAPLKLIFLFISPKEKMQEHLMFLAGVAALFQTEGLVE